MKTAVVTGGAGFIGSAIVRALLADPDVSRVVAVDNFSTGDQRNLAGCVGEVELVQADIRDRAALVQAFDSADWVFHEAAIASVARSVEAPFECHEINVTGTLNVLTAARDAAVARVVFASSSAVYGNTDRLPIGEDAPMQPESPYGIHKLTGELYARSFTASDGLETVSLRYFNVFGPRQAPDSLYSGVLAIFCRSALRGEAPTIDGDGAQTRDFVYVDDVARANVLAAKAGGVAGRVYNIGRGEEMSVADLWSAVQRASEGELAAHRRPARTGDVKHSLAEVSLAREQLGFEALVTVEDGLRATLDWYRANSPTH